MIYVHRASNIIDVYYTGGFRQQKWFGGQGASMLQELKRGDEEIHSSYIQGLYLPVKRLWFPSIHEQDVA